MIQIIKFMINIIIAFVIITIVVNIPAIFIQYNTVKKIETTMIKYAQKNGGFVPTTENDPKELLSDMIYEQGLTEKIIEIKYIPAYEKIAQRHEKIEIELLMEETIKIPFESKEIKLLIPVKSTGYSHKYYKDNNHE